MNRTATSVLVAGSLALGGVAVASSSCISIACEPGRATTCPPDQICDVRTRTCVAPSAGDGDGDGNGDGHDGSPCAEQGGCAPEPLVEDLEEPLMLHYDGGDLFLVTRPFTDGVAARIDPSTGQIDVLFSELHRASGLAPFGTWLLLAGDGSPSEFAQVWRTPRSGGLDQEQLFEGGTNDSFTVTAGGGYGFFLADGRLRRVDQQGAVDVVGDFGSAVEMAANDDYVFVASASTTWRVPVDAEEAGDAVQLPGPRDGRRPVAAALWTDDGAGRVYWATRAEDGSQGNLVRSDFEGGDWSYVVEGVDPDPGADPGAQIIALVARPQVVYYAVDPPGTTGGAIYQVREGQAPERLADADDPGGLAVGGGWLYFTEYGHGRVDRLPVD